MSIDAAGQEVDFAHEIAPLLKKHCAECHAGSQQKGGLSLNSRETLLAGGESGEAILVPGKSGAGELLARITAADKDLRMPPEGDPLTEKEIAIIKRWIDAGAPWEKGFTLGKRSYEPPLKPRRPELPPAQKGRDHPLDRILDAYAQQHQVKRQQPLEDAEFLRRASLDIVGLLPTSEQLETFLADQSPDKRARLVRELLGRDVEYAEHWLSFWNDLLRNDYTGTGFITGGRKQITTWLYEALLSNKPYDAMARELIAPSSQASVGFIEGIRWRGEVSAGQTVEIQFAQSVGQAFLGINLKCASCHDSFIDRWTLEEAYGMAAIYSQRPLEIHRCDKPLGKNAQAAWLFPEIGKIDSNAAQPERLQQLAALMTHPDNGRFTRTIVNRIWHRLMGRGIVHPVDAMQTEPFDQDLLDFLAVDLADHKYDMKRTIELIATSAAYQSQSEIVDASAEEKYVYAGPRAKRLTAEQFIDAVWQLTDTAPTSFDAQVLRDKADEAAAAAAKLRGQWIWSSDIPAGSSPPAGQTISLRKTFKLATAPVAAGCVITCDNEYTLYINGNRIKADNNWENVESENLKGILKAGENEILIVAKNAGEGANPAALFFEAVAKLEDGSQAVIATDASWQWSSTQPDANGKFAKDPADWKPASAVSGPWEARMAAELKAQLTLASRSTKLRVRASLVKSDTLMRSLGRPNRDQIVSLRPHELTTLEAMDLSNGQTLAELLERGSKNLVARDWKSPDELIRWLYRNAVSRDPSDQELAVLRESLGSQLTEQGIQDVLWAVMMLPEFQLVR